MNLRRGLAAAPGICSVVALGIALESGDPARAVRPPADGNYTFNEAGISGVTWTIPAREVALSGYYSIRPTAEKFRSGSRPAKYCCSVLLS
jgi:hypothetical protein